MGVQFLLRSYTFFLRSQKGGKKDTVFDDQYSPFNVPPYFFCIKHATHRKTQPTHQKKCPIKKMKNTPISPPDSPRRGFGSAVDSATVLRSARGQRSAALLHLDEDLPEEEDEAERGHVLEHVVEHVVLHVVLVEKVHRVVNVVVSHHAGVVRQGRSEDLL